MHGHCEWMNVLLWNVSSRQVLYGSVIIDNNVNCLNLLGFGQ